MHRQIQHTVQEDSRDRQCIVQPYHFLTKIRNNDRVNRIVYVRQFD